MYIGRRISFTSTCLSGRQVVILSGAQRNEESPCTNTGVSTRGFFAALRHRWSFRQHAVGMTIIIYLLSASYSFSQQPQQTYQLHIKKATGKIIIDGELNESDWQTANRSKDFYQNFPYDTAYALTKTEVMLTYDDNFIYVGAICYDEVPGNYIIQSLKRDFSFPVNDAFAVFLDPFNDQSNGFSFSVTPLGVQREGLIEGGGDWGVTTSWDNKWRSKVKRYNGRWIVEMAIPFKTIRYKEGITVWGINFSRNDLKRNERSTWVPIPRNFNVATLAYTGKLIWDESPKKAGSNIALIPYTIGNINRNYTAGGDTEINANAGIDAKVAITSSLNLDITVNSDFSQVEVDKQLINLTRFNLFFPEKRQFFIENSDLFSQFGFRQIRPFFSRRIGLYQGQTVPIIAGVRLSGKINKNWRIGLMNMQTEGKGELNLLSQNYTVATFQRQIFARSNIAGIFVNRQAFNNTELVHNDYNRIAGMDFNLASKDNKWRGKIFYHYSFTSDNLPNSSANASWLLYSTKNVFFMWNHEYVNKNYTADVGFVPRNTTFNPDSGKYFKQTYWRLEPKVQYKFYPKSSIINYHGPAIYSNDYFDEGFKTTDYFIMSQYIVNFLNTSEFQFHYHEFYTKLFFDTDITFSEGNPIPKGEYYYRNAMMKYQSDKRKRFYYSLLLKYGTYYLKDGTQLTYKAELTYRKQPWGIFSLNFSQDEIRLPQQYSNAYITLIGPKIELSFTKDLYFTTFIQYNTQSDNININSRFQWRFKPVSDIYIVYTDNYDANLGKKNRALVVKLIYWLSL